MATPTILIVGATGKQGGAVLAALSKLLPAAGTTTTKKAARILALTRSAGSPKAQALASRYPKLDLKVVEGDVKTPGPIFASNPGITSLFSYTTPPDEEAQAIPLIDAAADAGVGHIVFSSVERGGDVRSWDNPTGVKHFWEKHNVELHLRQKSQESGGGGGGTAGGRTQKLAYTILRPTAFFDNFNPGGVFGSVFASMWGTMPADTRLQLVSVHDIGVFGAKALLNPSQWSGRAVGLAGQELTLGEAREVFRRVAGTELPQTYWIVGKGVRWGVGEVGKMFQFFEDTGYGADIAKLRQEEPGLQDFEKWLRESSKFEFSEKA